VTKQIRPPTDRSFEEAFAIMFSMIALDFGIKPIYGLQTIGKPLTDKNDQVGASELKYPQIGYTITSQTNVANIERLEDDGCDNLKKVWDMQFEVMASFTVLHNNIYECIELANALNSWFKSSINDELGRYGVVIVFVTPVTTRDFLLVNDYERRQGFDVNIRLARTVSDDKQWINEVVIAGKVEAT